jgi:hypothetical protein
LYVSQSGENGWQVEMLTYPQGQSVGTIVPPNQPFNICSDTTGNVWMPTQQVVYKYAHGETSPTQSLSASGLFMNACAVDPTTGNLAVLGDGDSHTGPTFLVAIWPSATGNPTTYPLPLEGGSATYDDSGNLFIDGSSRYARFGLIELPKGSSTPRSITLDQPENDAGQIHWDGKYLAVNARRRGPQYVVYRVKVNGSSGHVVNTVVLAEESPVLGSYIKGSTFIGTSYNHNRSGQGIIKFWHYPRGGRAFLKIQGFSEAWGVTVSASHMRSRNR